MRTFFLPVNTGYSVNGDPTQQAEDFYRSRSGNGLYATIVGNVVLPEGVGSNDVSMRISSKPAWNRLAAAIEGEGAIAGIQLSSAWDNYVGIRQFKARRGTSPLSYYQNVASSFTSNYVRSAFNDLSRGTELAMKVGFRHLQLHAAHGYLFSLLLDPAFSPHAEEALSLTADWVNFLKREGVESSIRISLTTGMPEADDNRREFLERVFCLEPCFIDVSDGYYNVNKHLIYPSHEDVLEFRHIETLALARRFPRLQFIISGRASSLTFDEANVNIGLCRDLIANPNFLRSGDGCKNRMICHFYSRGLDSLSCGEWVVDDSKSRRS